jgi:hypothetical protein
VRRGKRKLKGVSDVCPSMRSLTSVWETSQTRGARWRNHHWINHPRGDRSKKRVNGDYLSFLWDWAWLGHDYTTVSNSCGGDCRRCEKQSHSGSSEMYYVIPIDQISVCPLFCNLASKVSDLNSWGLGWAAIPRPISERVQLALHSSNFEIDENPTRVDRTGVTAQFGT